MAPAEATITFFFCLKLPGVRDKELGLRNFPSSFAEEDVVVVSTSISISDVPLTGGAGAGTAETTALEGSATGLTLISGMAGFLVTERFIGGDSGSLGVVALFTVKGDA